MKLEEAKYFGKRIMKFLQKKKVFETPVKFEV
jgi:hypothetical protein